MKRLFLILIVLLFTACGKTPETFKILYYGNGNTSGYPPVDNNQYKSGSYATVLGQNTLQKNGAVFVGWNTKSDSSGTFYNSGSQIEVENFNIFLFAVWE